MKVNARGKSVLTVKSERVFNQNELGGLWIDTKNREAWVCVAKETPNFVTKWESTDFVTKWESIDDSRFSEVPIKS